MKATVQRHKHITPRFKLHSKELFLLLWYGAVLHPETESHGVWTEIYASQSFHRVSKVLWTVHLMPSVSTDDSLESLDNHFLEINIKLATIEIFDPIKNTIVLSIF